MSDEGSIDTRFKPGQSGNPKGRAVGSRSKVLVALDAFGVGEAEAIIKVQIEKAKAGDSVAARTILDRIWPPRRGSRIRFELPVVETASDLPGAIGRINQQVADGAMSPEEGAAVIGLLEAQRKAIETSEVADRIAVLEARSQMRR